MRLKVLGVLVLVCIFALPILFASSAVESNVLTKDSAYHYAQIVLTVYDQQVETGFRQTYRKYFDFYANLHYKIVATVSNAHGAALEFIPDNESSFDYETTGQRIEFAVFPNIDLNITSLDVNATVFVYTGEADHPMFVVNGSHNGISNMIIITNKGYLLDLGAEGSIMLSNVIVNNRYYYKIIAKGGNTTDSWSEDDARGFAMDIFEDDLYRAFNQSEEIREYMAYPILEKLISDIAWKHQHASDIGYDMLQYYEDLAQVRDLAVNKYHLNSTLVDEILSWLETIYPKQQWWELAPYSWILGGIIGAPLAIVTERIVKRAYYSRRLRSIHEKIRKRLIHEP
jgi:hypothetical protein